MLTLSGYPKPLHGRSEECETLRGFLTQKVEDSLNKVLVISGASGLGKTALLDYAVQGLDGRVVLRTTGVASHADLAFAALHELLRPLSGYFANLPATYARALSSAFGIREEPAPDVDTVASACLRVLRVAASERPIICLVDDAHRLDSASASCLLLLAERLSREAVFLLVTVPCMEESAWARFPLVQLNGLTRVDAHEFLRAALPTPVDPRIQDRLVAESRGNPQALMRVSQAISPSDLSFGPVRGEPPALLAPDLAPDRPALAHRLSALRPRTRLFLVLASAEPLGDVALLLEAAHLLGIAAADMAAAEATGWVEIRDTVRFRDSLVRSAIYLAAEPGDRTLAHEALGQVTDPRRDPDRQAWHRGSATTTPDESVAAALERSAGIARTHGGYAAAAACLRRAAALTPRPDLRARRELAAAEVTLSSGAPEEAARLLTAARQGPLTHLERTRVEVLQARIGREGEDRDKVLPLLLAAASHLETLDLDLARDTYVEAVLEAIRAGRLSATVSTRDVARHIIRAGVGMDHRAASQLLTAMAVRFTDGLPAAARLLRTATQAYAGSGPRPDSELTASLLACAAGGDLWDLDAWQRLTTQHLQRVRRAGALRMLPLAITSRGLVDLFSGQLEQVEDAVKALHDLALTGQSVIPPYLEVALNGFRGPDEQASRRIQGVVAQAHESGEGMNEAVAHWAHAVLDNAVGKYTTGLEHAEAAAAHPDELGVSSWALEEVVEAGVRTREIQASYAAVERLKAVAAATGTDWAMGIAARGTALLGSGEAAEDGYRESIALLQRTRAQPALARTRLLYGEWLRRAGRRLDAREQLRAALQSFTTMGMQPFAVRTARELAATGETVRKRATGLSGQLTPQERHIALAAARGLTNPEIGAELFISARTVEWHLGKIFAKLGVKRRRELAAALVPEAPPRR